MYPDIFESATFSFFGCAWTSEFDLITLRVDGEIFESGEIRLRD